MEHAWNPRYLAGQVTGNSFIIIMHLGADILRRSVPFEYFIAGIDVAPRRKIKTLSILSGP